MGSALLLPGCLSASDHPSGDTVKGRSASGTLLLTPTRQSVRESFVFAFSSPVLILSRTPWFDRSRHYQVLACSFASKGALNGLRSGGALAVQESVRAARVHLSVSDMKMMKSECGCLQT